MQNQTMDEWDIFVNVVSVVMGIAVGVLFYGMIYVFSNLDNIGIF